MTHRSTRLRPSHLPASRLSLFAVLSLITLLASEPSRAAGPGPVIAPDREFRGAWVASVYNLDWPSKPGLSTSQQQAELRAILDRAAGLNLNAILLQVRPACDALYASKREPWSQFLTGKMGRAPEPFYDPLEFAVKEAHARGLELHAWFNPFRALANAAHPVSTDHISKTHPEWVRRYGSQLWLDPGEPAARDYALGVITDVVRRYAIDGVHIDDYFYPYPVKGAGEFPDDASWQRHGGGVGRGDWRRSNINRFVEALYRAVKMEKRDVQVGISPFGIARPGVPMTIEAGLDAYAQLFADAPKWLREGWCDYLAPQLYWNITPAKQSFPVLLDWWRAQSRGRPVWPGIATGRVGDTRPAREIESQIILTRVGMPGTTAPGHIHWNMKALMQNRGGVSDLLKQSVYREKADVPR